MKLLKRILAMIGKMIQVRFGKGAIRCFLITGRHWFVAQDIYRAFRMNTSTALSRRLAGFELYRCYTGKKKVILVSSSGLIGLFPNKREYWPMRQAILELITKHQDPPGLCPLKTHPVLHFSETSEN